MAENRRMDDGLVRPLRMSGFVASSHSEIDPGMSGTGRLKTDRFNVLPVAEMNGTAWWGAAHRLSGNAAAKADVLGCEGCRPNRAVRRLSETCAQSLEADC